MSLFLSLAFGVGAQDMPDLPDTGSFITCFPDTTGYKRITVGPEGRDFTDLQEAILAATPSTVIELDAGAVFYGGFELPDKGPEEGWIILISSRMDLLPPEQNRIMPFDSTGDEAFPLQSHAMPKIITEHLSGIPCLRTRPNAHAYRLVGLEITVDPAVRQSFGLVNFGETSAAQNSLEEVPHHLIADRCFIHGHDEAEIMKYGIRLDCAFGAVIHCHISQFHSVGFDAQAISCINGPGPFKILNNYLEASGENILIGGGAPSISGLVPSDIEIRQNHFYKPWSWRVGHPEYAGIHWTIKNLFELKTGRRVLLDGNLLENSWADLPIGQSGYAILLTVRTEGGQSPQADVSDITIRNNIVRHVGSGISLSGSDGVQSNRSSRIRIYNNLFDQIDGPEYGDQNIFGPNDGTFLKIGNPQNVIVDHNTIFQSGPITWAYQVTDSLAFTHNLVNCFASPGGYQGIYGPGQSQGNATLAAYFPDITDENRHFHKNVLLGGDSTKYTYFSFHSHNDFPPAIEDVYFSDYSNGLMDYHGYVLDPASPYFAFGDDGSDIGVNFNRLDSAMSVLDPCDPIISSLPGKVPDIMLTISPNPVHDLLRVQVNVAVGTHYLVCNSMGIPVQSGTITSQDFMLDSVALSPGVYTLIVRSLPLLVSQRFVKL